MKQAKRQISDEGFAVLENIYSEQEVKKLIAAINLLDSSLPTFRKSKDLFAIRQFLNQAPEVSQLIFSANLIKVINEIFGTHYFVTKSMYFDKPENSNWFVAYHQDLTISVDKRIEIENYTCWTAKQNQYAVQPPLHILENNFTLRIHLDDTDVANGALKVIPNSHKKGIYRAETIDWKNEKEICCSVPKGGIMVMKPLLLHASNRTTNSKQRRVVHIEFSKYDLPKGLRWSERFSTIADGSVTL